jgi:hypothetical protein
MVVLELDGGIAYIIMTRSPDENVMSHEGEVGIKVGEDSDVSLSCGADSLMWATSRIFCTLLTGCGII